ncbi:MAG TPA: hypothetical protein VGF13_12560, partial [Verrucomicrobiae bacterium]
YFNEFSSRVISRIERGEARLSWWERLGFDLRPALAAGAGLVACGLIVYGVATTEGEAGAASGPGLMGFNVNDAALQPSPVLVNSENTVAANSTNPVPTYGARIDRNGWGALVTPASFQR